MKPKIIFCDFDGTLTHGSSLGSIFFDIIDTVNNTLNSELIIVTGRSVSWAHFLLTHFELFVVISEGGGMVSLKDESGRIEDLCLVSEEDLKVLNDFEGFLEKHFEEIPLTADSYGRKTDRAIDLLDLQTPKVKEKLQKLMDEEGIKYSCSNVHLNFWRGNISKASACKFYLENYEDEISENDCLYFGDSMNDESMFKEYPNTVGVSNINAILDQLKHRPKIILTGKENEGPNGVLNYLMELSK